MKILITGAAGFVGSHLFNKMNKIGYEVYGIDNLIRGKLSNLTNKKKFFKIDIRNKKKINFFFKKYGPFKIVIHQATLINKNLEEENIIEDIDLNVCSTINLINIAYKFGMKKFVYASSIAVYGKIKKKQVDEVCGTEPITSYGISKLMTEKYIKYLSKNRLTKMDYTILRYSNIYGPNQSDLGEVGVIRNFIKKLEKSNTIFKHGNGKQTRDFIFVTDAVDATIKATLTKHKRLVLNISSNIATSVNSIISNFRRLIDKKIKIRKKKNHSNEYFYFKSSNKLARLKLKWQPQVKLNEGIELTIKNKNE